MCGYILKDNYRSEGEELERAGGNPSRGRKMFEICHLKEAIFY